MISATGNSAEMRISPESWRLSRRWIYQRARALGLRLGRHRIGTGTGGTPGSGGATGQGGTVGTGGDGHRRGAGGSTGTGGGAGGSGGQATGGHTGGAAERARRALPGRCRGRGGGSGAAGIAGAAGTKGTGGSAGGGGGATSTCGGGTAAGTDVTVQLGSFGQTMDGFGISNTYQSTAISDATADQFFDQTKGIGLSIFRLGIKSDGTSWGPIGDAKKAADRGAIVWAAPWTPPSNCKSNNSPDNGGHLISTVTSTTLLRLVVEHARRFSGAGQAERRDRHGDLRPERARQLDAVRIDPLQRRADGGLHQSARPQAQGAEPAGQAALSRVDALGAPLGRR